MTMTFIARKSLLAIAAGMTLASGAFAQSAPSVTLYGTFDLGIESANDGALTKTMLQNYTSKFGIKGERNVSSDLSGIFQLETAVSPDDAKAQNTPQTTGVLGARNSFVGLKSASMGTFMAGTYDTPFKSLNAGGLVNTLGGEGEALEIILHGKASTTAINAPNGGSAATIFGNVHTRQANSLVYVSPKFADVVIKALYSPDEGQTATSNAPTYSLSAEWNNGTYNLGAATQQKALSGTALYAMSASKVTMGAVMGNFSAGLAFTTLDNQAASAANARRTTNAMGTVNYTEGPWNFKLAYAQASESKSGAADGVNETSLEALYNLDKQTALYAGYTQLSNGTNAKGSYAGGNADNFPVASGYGVTVSATTFGLRYSF